MTKIKFAIVGCGSIGKRHIAVLDSDSEAEIVAICDSDENKCKELSSLYNGLAYYTSYNEMLENITCDVVNVVTPHQMHADMTIDALKKGFNVLVEKPMALTKSDCEAIIFKALQMHKNVFCVMQNRYSPPSIWINVVSKV